MDEIILLLNETGGQSSGLNAKIGCKERTSTRYTYRQRSSDSLTDRLIFPPRGSTDSKKKKNIKNKTKHAKIIRDDL